MGLLLVALLAFGNWRAARLLADRPVADADYGGLRARIRAAPERAQRLLPGHPALYRHPVSGLGLPDPDHLPHHLRAGQLPDLAQAQPDDRRQPVLPGRALRRAAPGWLQFGYFTAWAIGMFVAGLLVFNRLEAGLAEEL